MTEKIHNLLNYVPCHINIAQSIRAKFTAAKLSTITNWRSSKPNPFLSRGTVTIHCPVGQIQDGARLQHNYIAELSPVLFDSPKIWYIVL